MWVSTHVLAGLAIAAALGGPWWLLLVLVLLAHILMDLIPHWDYTVLPNPKPWIAGDCGASLLAFLVAWLLLGYPWWIAFMGLVSGAPDLDVLARMLFGSRWRKLFPSHWARFPHGASGPLWGVGIQVVVMVAGVAIAVCLRP